MKLTRKELGAIVTKEGWFNRYTVTKIKWGIVWLVSFDGGMLVEKNDPDFLVLQRYQEDIAGE